MPFIISAGTSVSSPFDTGVQSINLSLTPQIQRLYALGTGIPFDKNIINQSQLSISRYSRGTNGGGIGPGGNAISVLSSENCTESDFIELTIEAGGCSGANITDTHDWFITSYSYSKDVQGWGTETWGFISRPIAIGTGSITPRMIRGIAEGQKSNDTGDAVTGINFILTSTQIPGNSIEASAGSPGIGKALTMVYAEVASIGGSTGKSDGRIATGSVSIPYTPIYIAT